MFQRFGVGSRYNRATLASTQSNPELLNPAVQGSCYPAAASKFVIEGLRYTCERTLAQHSAESMATSMATSMVAGDERHLTGQQLSLGLREYAIDRFGMLAPCVLRTWNIVRTEDFGRIVYALIEMGELSRSTDDSIDDFRCVFDFEEAFSLTSLARRVASA